MLNKIKTAALMTGLFFLLNSCGEGWSDDYKNCGEPYETKCSYGRVYVFDSCRRPVDIKQTCAHGCLEASCLSEEMFPWTDPDTGLVWSGIAPLLLTWEEALRYCGSLDGDWKLPSVDELRTLIVSCPQTEPGGSCKISDNCTDSSCENRENCSFSCWYDSSGKYSKFGDFHYFWSSVKYSSAHSSAIVVDFGGAGVFYYPMIKELFVRCVSR